MKIVAIEAIPFGLPVRREFRWAGLESAVGHFVLVRIRTDEGLEGIGEATPLRDWGGDYHRRYGETQQTVCHVIKEILAPSLVGADPLSVSKQRAAMARLVRGHSYAKTALEMALHDLVGKVAGLPIHRLWGGPAREGVPVAHMVGIMPRDAAVAEAEQAVAEGVGALQVKGGKDAERDVEVVTAIRDRVGPRVIIRLDANQGYGRPKEALATISRLEGIVDMVEQPVEGLDFMAQVTANSPLEIIADESCWDGPDALELAIRGAADLVSVYVAKAGGLQGAMAVASVVGASGRICDVNGSLESGVGTAANIQFALAATECRLPCVVTVPGRRDGAATAVAGRYYEDDIVAEQFVYSDGRLGVLSKAGLGVSVDEEKLSQYRQD